MSFEDKIKLWVLKDNQMKLYLEKLRELRSERNDIGEILINYTQNNNLNHSIIQISDGKLKFQETRIASPLTYKFMEECLYDCIENSEDVKQIISYIKNKRRVRCYPDIKRVYNKTS